MSYSKDFSRSKAADKELRDGTSVTDSCHKFISFLSSVSVLGKVVASLVISLLRIGCLIYMSDSGSSVVSIGSGDDCVDLIADDFS